MVAAIVVLEGILGAIVATILCVLQACGAIGVGWGWAVSPLPISVAIEAATTIAAFGIMSASEEKDA